MGGSGKSEGFSVGQLVVMGIFFWQNVGNFGDSLFSLRSFTVKQPVFSLIFAKSTDFKNLPIYRYIIKWY